MVKGLNKLYPFLLFQIVTVGGAKIIAGDIAAVNGVVHVVDKVRVAAAVQL